MATQKLNISELDFDNIKASFITYLESQSQFDGYNWEGQSLNIMLDLLAFNTYYNSYYTNMIANECHLDSAITRNAVVSEAKKLGYTPRSYLAPTATVDIVVSPDDGTGTTAFTLSKYTNFSATKNGVTYNFYNTTAVSVDKVGDNPNGTYTFSDIDIKEGQITSTVYEVNISDTSQKFIIPNIRIDTSTLVVKIQTSSTVTTTSTYTLATSLLEIDSGSLVYFLQEKSDNEYEVYFGDGVTGKALEDGNLVILEYITTNGIDANDIGVNDNETSRTFSAIMPDGYTSIISVDIISSGGAVNESISSIKFIAPLFYQAQNRAVTERDYKVLIKAQFADIEAINVWGGQKNTPPDYGKTFISIKPISGTHITQTTKDSIISFLSDSKNIVSIIPEFVDPDSSFIIVTTTVDYNSSTLSGSATDVQSSVEGAIINYGSATLNDFGNKFRYSNLTEDIDESHTSIVSSLTDIKLKKLITPTIGTGDNYSIDFNNELHTPDVGTLTILESNAFTYVDNEGETYISYLDDDGAGNVRIYRILDLVRLYMFNTVGTINYTTGVINLVDFNPLSILSGSTLELKVKLKYNDIESNQNNLLFINSEDITVTTTGV